jgi:HK97 gp10 family phage protein
MTVTVTGLKEVQSSLKEIGDVDSQKEVRAALKQGVEIIAVNARGRVPSRTGRAAASIKSSTSGAKGYITGGKGSVPYYGWLDFGTRNPRHGNTRKEGPWRGSGTGPQKGRFIYPAIEAKQDELVSHLEQAVGKVIKRVGLD